MVTDASRLARLSAVLGYPVSADTMEHRLRRVLARAEDLILVADSSGAGIVGWIHAAERDTLESDLRCEILGLIVDPEHRGRGVGRRLVAAVETWAIGRGLEEVAVRSNVTRIVSHPFYERLCFIRMKTSHIYRKPIPEPPPS